MTASCEVHTLRTWGLRILLLQAFESVWTSHQNYRELKELLLRRILLLRSAENTSFCNSSSFSLSFSEYKPFFSTELLFCSFSLILSCATVSLIFPYTADVDFVLFSTGKILTLRKKSYSSFAFCGGRYLLLFAKKKKRKEKKKENFY